MYAEATPVEESGPSCGGATKPKPRPAALAPQSLAAEFCVHGGHGRTILPVVDRFCGKHGFISLGCFGAGPAASMDFWIVLAAWLCETWAAAKPAGSTLGPATPNDETEERGCNDGDDEAWDAENGGAKCGVGSPAVGGGSIADSRVHHGFLIQGRGCTD